MSKADHVQRCRKRTQDAGRQSRARHINLLRTACQFFRSPAPTSLHLQEGPGGEEWAREGGRGARGETRVMRLPHSSASAVKCSKPSERGACFWWLRVLWRGTFFFFHLAVHTLRRAPA